MKDGSIDAMFWSGGLPTSGITDLFTSQRGNVKFLDVTSTLDKLKEINPIYERGVIPAATYETPADVPTVVVPNLLLVNEDLDGNTACVLTKALFEHKADLVKVNKAAEDISLDTARQTEPGAVAPGCPEGTRRTRRDELTEREDDDDRHEPAGGHTATPPAMPPPMRKKSRPAS